MIARGDAAVKSYPFYPMHVIIFEALCEHPYGLTVHELIERVYSNPDEEPDHATDNIRVCISRMNRRYQSFNAPFRIRPGGLHRYVLFIRRVRK